MPRRELDLKDLPAVLAEVELLHRRGYEKLGQWNLAQVLDHLGYFMKGSLDGWTLRVPWLVKVLLGRRALRKILAERKMKVGGYTPYKPQSPGQDEAAAVECFRGLIQRLVAKDATFHDSPFHGHLTSEQWREMHLIHCNHHLAFLRPKG